jgi:DNA excision repair protein ERCC-3
MKVEILNHIIRIDDPDFEIESDLMSKLSYIDKSKQYQIKKMQRNPFSMKSKLYEQLVRESQGSLVEKVDNNIFIPSGFCNYIQELASQRSIQVLDSRCETGTTIALPWANNTYSLQLRDYQKEAVDTAILNWRGIINFATGLGKTKTAISLIRTLKKKTLIICPSNSVANQFKDELVLAFGPGRVGFIGDGKYKPSDITVCIAASANNSIDKIKKIDLGLVIFDECHHTPANTFYSISQGLAHVGRIYGLTATSFRSDGKDTMITAGCGDILVKRDAAWGISNNWLAQPYFIIRKIKTTGTDFKDDKLKSYKNHVLNSKEMTSRIESDARKFIEAGKSVLILVDEVEHGNMLSKALGVPFAQGEDKQSNNYVDQLNKGTIPGLVGTDGKISEGTDTRNVDVLILSNFSSSIGSVLQAVGRGLRKTDKKNHVIVLDYVPTGSTMLTRHAGQRISYYKEITSNIKLVE